MTLQPLQSEFPYIWGNIIFIFYQCRGSPKGQPCSLKVTAPQRPSVSSYRLNIHSLKDDFKIILSLCSWPDTWTCGDANVWATWAWRRCRCAVPRASAPWTSGSVTSQTWGCAPSPAPAPLSGSWACAAVNWSQTRGSRWWRTLVELSSILTFRYNGQKRGIFLNFFLFYVRYSTRLHLSPPSDSTVRRRMLGSNPGHYGIGCQML